MSDTGWVLAGTGSNGSGFAFTNPENITANDNSYATYGADGFSFSEVKLILADGSIATENKSDSSTMEITETLKSFGGASDTWSETLTSTDINDSDFGVAFKFYTDEGPGFYTAYLKATNFGFSIPSGATINGIETRIALYEVINPELRIDSVEIKIYYTESGTPSITYNEGTVIYSSSLYTYSGQSTAQQFDRAISSVIGLTDSLDYAAVMAIGIQDAIGITDGLLRTHSVIRTLTEQEGITDFLDKNSAYIRTTIDNEGITDSLNYILSIQRSLQDALGLTDVIKYNFTLNRFLEDSEGLTDNLDRVSSYVKEIVDSIGLTDVLNRISSLSRSLEDSEGLTDSLVASLTKLISIGDSVGISDVLNKVSQMPRDISDSEGLTDLLDAKITILRAILDNEGITDNLDAIKKIIINISDDVGISDAIGVLTRGIDQTIAQIWDIDDTKPVMMSVSMNKSDLKIVINEKPSYDSIGKTLAVFQSTSTIYDDPLTDYDSATQVYGGPDPRQEIGKTPATVSVYKPEIISVGGL